MSVVEQELDVYNEIYRMFRFLEQDIIQEATFRELLAEVIEDQSESYTVLLRLWEEHAYITVLRQPGKPRAIEIGTAFDRDYHCIL